jgi:hypothetical protein
VNEKPSETSSMTLRVVPSESATMTPRVNEKPSETSSMTLRVVPSESATMTPRVNEKPSETSSMTLRVVPSESATMTPRVVPSETSSMTLRVVPSESATMTSRVVPSETSSMTLRIIEKPSDTSTMTPRIIEELSVTARVIVRPSTDISDQTPVRDTQTVSGTSLRRRPSNSQYPSRTVGYVKPSYSALPSRLPQPTKYIIFSPIPVTRRPSPSPAIKPPVVTSQLVINNGNVTYLSEPKTLQYIQASLACAAGVPLEHIRILNITQKANGTQTVVLYDKSAAGLMSNGSAACYRPIITTASPHANRRMQTVDENSVAVDYSIVEPPLALLDPVAFVAAVTSDIGIASIIAESGASGVDVIVPQEVIDYATFSTQAIGAASTPINNDVQSDKTPMYIGIAAGIGGVCALVAAIVVTNMKKKSAGKLLTKRIDIVEVNPTVRALTHSERHVFVPGQVRV